MSGTYKATGINLKAMPLGESDRLLTILTQEFGLIRAVAPGSRKHQSRLRGCSGLFVVNQLLIAKGRSLDKITQAESLESFSGLSRDLGKLTAGQYLAELVLCQALSNQPQAELFCLLREHLSRLEKLPSLVTLACLAHATFHMLALAGVAPQVHACCVTQQPLTPDFTDLDWRVGFSVVAGGTVSLAELERSTTVVRPVTLSRHAAENGSRVSERTTPYQTTPQPQAPPKSIQLTATELALLQQLTQLNLIQSDGTLPQSHNSLPQPSDPVWLSIERVLRQYAQYHFERPIRSAMLIDTCFLSLSKPPLSEL